MWRRSPVSLAAFLGLLFAKMPDANAVAYLALNLPGQTPSYATGINNLGQIVIVDTTATGKGTLIFDGVSNPVLSVPGFDSTVGNGINDAGEVVGSAFNAGRASIGFVYKNGAYTTVAVPGATETTLLGVNNAGQIVGEYKDAANVSHAFLDTNGIFVTLNVPGSNGTNTAATGINNKGEVIGIVTTNIAVESFTYIQGVYTIVQAPAPSTALMFGGVNDLGQVAATYTSSSGLPFYFSIYDNGTFTPVDESIEPPRTLYDINNAGDLVGGGSFDPDRVPPFYGAVALYPILPVPEPSSLVLLGVPLIGLASFRYRRR